MGPGGLSVHSRAWARRRLAQIHDKQPVSRHRASTVGGRADLQVDENDLKSPSEGLSGNLGDPRPQESGKGAEGGRRRKRRG